MLFYSRRSNNAKVIPYFKCPEIFNFSLKDNAEFHTAHRHCSFYFRDFVMLLIIQFGECYHFFPTASCCCLLLIGVKRAWAIVSSNPFFVECLYKRSCSDCGVIKSSYGKTKIHDALGLSARAVFNGILKTMGTDDSWEVSQTCSNGDGAGTSDCGECINGLAHFTGNSGWKEIITQSHKFYH